MTLLGWIIFGLITGIIANLIDPQPEEGGIVGAMVLGILGAVVGGFLANIVVGESVSGFNVLSFVIAILGSLFLLFIGRALRKA
jgi:uncharacterized membrane protein YeaQ/YmgE (transglycosylase-associated protein family)